MKIKYNKAFFKRKVTAILLSTSLLGSIVGCSSKDNFITKLEDKGFSIETINYDDNTLYKIENNDTKYFENIDDESIGYKTFLPYDYNTLYTPLEFSNYMGYSNITWNDIRNTLNSNNNLDKDIKDIILKGINNLEKNKYDINLGVLKYNLESLTIEYVENIYGVNNVPAVFYPDEQKVIVNSQYIDNPSYERVLYHEVLGHGSSMAYIKDNGGIFCSNSFETILVENKDIYGYSVFGNSFGEALADYVSYLATDRKISYIESNYLPTLYFLKILCDSNGISMEKYANEGIKCLTDKMNSNGMSNQIELINYMDMKLYLLTVDNKNVNVTYNEIILSYLCDLAINRKGNNKSYSEVIDEIATYLDSFYTYMEPALYNNRLYLVCGTEEANDSLDLTGLGYSIAPYLKDLYSKTKIK